MEFIDTHTHLSDEVFENGGEDVVRKAIEAGVSREPLLANCLR